MMQIDDVVYGIEATTDKCHDDSELDKIVVVAQSCWTNSAQKIMKRHPRPTEEKTKSHFNGCFQYVQLDLAQCLIFAEFKKSKNSYCLLEKIAKFI